MSGRQRALQPRDEGKARQIVAEAWHGRGQGRVAQLKRQAERGVGMALRRRRGQFDMRFGIADLHALGEPDPAEIAGGDIDRGDNRAFEIDRAVNTPYVEAGAPCRFDVSLTFDVTMTSVLSVPSVAKNPSWRQLPCPQLLICRFNRRKR